MELLLAPLKNYLCSPVSRSFTGQFEDVKMVMVGRKEIASPCIHLGGKKLPLPTWYKILISFPKTMQRLCKVKSGLRGAMKLEGYTERKPDVPYLNDTVLFPDAKIQASVQNCCWKAQCVKKAQICSILRTEINYIQRRTEGRQNSSFLPFLFITYMPNKLWKIRNCFLRLTNPPQQYLNNWKIKHTFSGIFPKLTSYTVTNVGLN